MKPSILIAGAAALGLALASAAVAQPPDGGPGPGGGGGRGALRQACMADFQKFCPDAKPGPGGGMRECVMTHHADFSQPCQTAPAQMRAARAQRQPDSGASPAPQ